MHLEIIYLMIDKFWMQPLRNNPDNIYLFKVNNRNFGKWCEICSKLTIKTPERRHWRRFGVFIVNFEHISHLSLVFLLLTLNIVRRKNSGLESRVGTCLYKIWSSRDQTECKSFFTFPCVASYIQEALQNIHFKIFIKNNNLIISWN